MAKARKKDESAASGQAETASVVPAEIETIGNHARLRHPEGVGCSWQGQVYKASADGSVAVPAEAMRALAAHGFAPIEEK